MEQFDSLWSYRETMDEMRQKLLYTSLELEKVKMEANEEQRKNNENVKQLVQLIKMAYQEIDHFQQLLNKTSQADLLNNLSQIQVDCPLVKATKANSSTIESNSLTETYNYQSHNSSPVESFVSAPDLPNIGSNAMTFVNQPLFQDHSVTVSKALVPQEVPKFDQASLIIDSLIKGKPLPQQGKFLQAVLEAGPLLQTLLVAGPLPRWHNPPQFKPLHIPPVSIKGCEAGLVTQNSSSYSSHFASSLNSQPYFEMSSGSSQVSSP